MTATLDTAATREDFITTMIERNGDPSTLKVFADWLEQRGECDLAYAYRWAASRGLWPCTKDGVMWAWNPPWERMTRATLPEFFWHRTERVVGRVEGLFQTLAATLARLRKDVAIADDN